MQKNAIVKSTVSPDPKRSNVVIVEPVAFTECASCSQSCTKRGRTLPVLNSQNFTLKPGSLVIIANCISIWIQFIYSINWIIDFCICSIWICTLLIINMVFFHL